MALPVITDTIRVSVEGILANGNGWASIFHYRKTAILTYSGAITILDPLLIATYSTNAGAGLAWAPLASPSCSIQRIRYTPLDGSTVTTVISHVLPGSNTSADPLPAGVAMVTTFYTAKRGRSYRGRVYTPGWTEGSNNSVGQIPAASATGWNTQWTAQQTALSSSGVTHVVASYLHSTAENVVSYNTNTIWDSQRRRNRV
jgi:hypothetical protein